MAFMKAFTNAGGGASVNPQIIKEYCQVNYNTSDALDASKHYLVTIIYVRGETTSGSPYAQYSIENNTLTTLKSWDDWSSGKPSTPPTVSIQNGNLVITNSTGSYNYRTIIDQLD